MSDNRSTSIITRSLSWVDKLAKVKRFFWGLVVAGAALTVLDLIYKKKVYFEVEYVFGFYSLYGFFMCAALVVAARGMRFLLMRREDFYGPTDTAAEDHPEFDLDRKQAGDLTDV